MNFRIFCLISSLLTLILFWKKIVEDSERVSLEISDLEKMKVDKFNIYEKAKKLSEEELFLLLSKEFSFEQLKYLSKIMQYGAPKTKKKDKYAKYIASQVKKRTLDVFTHFGE